MAGVVLEYRGLRCDVHGACVSHERQRGLPTAWHCSECVERRAHPHALVEQARELLRPARATPTNGHASIATARQLEGNSPLQVPASPFVAGDWVVCVGTNLGNGFVPLDPGPHKVAQASTGEPWAMLLEGHPDWHWYHAKRFRPATPEEIAAAQGAATQPAWTPWVLQPVHQPEPGIAELVERVDQSDRLRVLADDDLLERIIALELCNADCLSVQAAAGDCATSHGARLTALEERLRTLTVEQPTEQSGADKRCCELRAEANKRAEAAEADLKAHMQGNSDLRRRYGARDGETMFDFLDRAMVERDEARAELARVTGEFHRATTFAAKAIAAAGDLERKYAALVEADAVAKLATDALREKVAQELHSAIWGGADSIDSCSPEHGASLRRAAERVLRRVERELREAKP